MELRLDDLRDAAGIGVAGNVAGHLEQAGEARDFEAVDAGPDAPRGIFPWYVPGDAGFLGTFPLDHDRLTLPEGADLQIEPEVGVLVELDYDGDAVAAVRPVAAGAFDDCSIRREGAPKISVKKNWGPASKGAARTFFEVPDLEAGGGLAGLRLASFLRRDGEVHAYGLDTPVTGYSAIGQRLLDWLGVQLREQRGEEGTPLEDVGALLAGAGRPARALIGIGATKYTPLGESTYLRAGDEALVVVYDGDATRPEAAAAAVLAGEEDALPRASVLRQRVEAA